MKTQTTASVELRDIEFRWTPGAEPVLALPALRIGAGERVFVQGPSGSGKSTLISLIAGVGTPGRGEVSVLGEPISRWRGARRDRFRVDHIGLIFQQFNLLPHLSVLENTLLPCWFSRRRRDAATAAGGPAASARRLLDGLGLGGQWLDRPVSSLSVGQRQRVAAARALIGAPEIIIADEPTSALDQDNRDRFIEHLFEQAGAIGSTVVFVSHDITLAHHFSRVLCLRELNQAPSAHRSAS